MYQQLMIGQTSLRILAGGIAGVAVLAALTTALLLLRDGSSAPPGPDQVPAGEVLDSFSVDKMAEVGLYVMDDNPSDQPRVSLSEAAAYLKQEAGVASLLGALVLVNTVPANPNTGFLRGMRSESLVWAIRVDPALSTVPGLFDPQATGTIAFVDALEGGLLGVLAQ